MKRSISCPSCRRDLFPDDAYCSQCGSRVQPRRFSAGEARRTLVHQTVPTAERVACGSCNTPQLPGEVFCSTCGARNSTADPTPFEEARLTGLRKLREATRARYEVVGELGRGGMGSVYLARELDLDRFVAVKVLSANWLSDDAMVERFRREARTIASLRHPSIVHVHGVGTVDDMHYFTMDYIDGVSLASMLRLHGPLSIPAAQAILYQVGSALSYAHRPGRAVIHRDIKPGNIMLDAEGNAFVTDFGVSKVAEGQSGLTATGLIIGTPEYMSPEQCRGDEATPASDQYALGAVVFAMLTGAPPFTGPNYSVLMAHTADPPPSLLEVRPDCPKPLADAVARMLAKAPGERWPDIREALKAAGIRPVSADDPVRDEVAEWVRRTMDAHAVRRTGTGVPAGRRLWLRVAVVPNPMETGEAANLRATMGYADGREVEGRDVVWVSGDPSIARFDPDSGQLVAVGAGTTVITGSSSGLSQSLDVAVHPARVASLDIEHREIELEAGATIELRARPRDRRGNPLLGRAVFWSSSDPGIATVSDDGRVHAHRPGSASILAHCLGVGATARVRVVPARVAALEILDLPASLTTGAEVRLSARALDANGTALDRALSWSSSDETILRLDGDAVATAVSPGTADIVVACGDIVARAHVEVRPEPVRVVTLSPPPAELVVGDRFHLVARCLGHDDAILDREPDWGVDRPNVMTSLGHGRFQAEAPGAARITVRADTVTAEVAVSVEPVRVTSLALQKRPTRLQVTERLRLWVDLRDQRGRTIDRPIRWSTSDDAVVRVSPEGVLEAVAAGVAEIAAESEGVRETVRIHVPAPLPHTPVTPRSEAPQVRDAADSQPVGTASRSGTIPALRRHPAMLAAMVVLAGLGLLWLGRPRATTEPLPTVPPAIELTLLDAVTNEPVRTIELIAGDSVVLTGHVTDPDGVRVADAAIDWASENAEIASVDGNGLLRARSGGDTRIRARAGGLERELVVTVVAPVVTTETVDSTRSAGAGPPRDPLPPRPAPRAPDAELHLVVVPWANIFIDGVRRGTETSRLVLPLPPGAHHIRLENPGWIPVDTTFEMASGGTYPLTIRLRRTPP